MSLSCARLAEIHPGDSWSFRSRKIWGGHLAGMWAASCYLIGVTIAMGFIVQQAGKYDYKEQRDRIKDRVQVRVFSTKYDDMVKDCPIFDEKSHLSKSFAKLGILILDLNEKPSLIQKRLLLVGGVTAVGLYCVIKIWKSL